MLIHIRYTKSAGNNALYVRLRNQVGEYYDFNTRLWGATEAPSCKVFLVEYPDADPYESTYLNQLAEPVLAGNPLVFSEVVAAASGEVIGQESLDLSRVKEAITNLSIDGDGQLTATFLIPSLSGAVYSPTVVYGQKISVVAGDTPTISATLNNDYSAGWTAELVLSLESPVTILKTVPCSWVNATTGALMVELTAVDTAVAGVYDCSIKVRKTAKCLTALRFTLVVVKDT